MVEVVKFFDSHMISLKKDRFWRYNEKDDSVTVTFIENRTNEQTDLHFNKEEFHKLRTSIRIKELEDMKESGTML